MCVVGKGKLNESTAMQNKFTWKVLTHQKAQGYGASVENPKGSLLFQQEMYVKTFGSIDTPKPGWHFYRFEGCQFRVVYRGKDDPGRPIQKAMIWLSCFDLSELELRCRHPAALVGSSHEHRHARGNMLVECEGWQSVARASGRYTPETAAVYAKCVRSFVYSIKRRKSDVGSDLKAVSYTHLTLPTKRIV